ncbi:MAG: hypothetical protein ABI680_06565, partial [Chthoniobacteraceae bacterium]
MGSFLAFLASAIVGLAAAWFAESRGLELPVMADPPPIITKPAATSQTEPTVGEQTISADAPELRDPSAAIRTALDSWSTDPLQAQSELYDTFQRFTAQDFQKLTRDPHFFDVLTAPLENDLRAQRAFVDGLVARWVVVDEEAAFAWLASKPPLVRWGVATADFAVEAFARVRPERMLDHVLSLPPNDDRRTIAAALIRTVGETDVKRAKEWIDRFDDPSTRAAAERGYLEATARLDPFSVLNSANPLSASDAGGVWDAATKEAVRRGGSVAKALAEKAENPGQRMSIAFALRPVDPESAAELISEQAGREPNTPLPWNAASQVAAAFARRDLEKARVWAEALPATLRAEALPPVMIEWAGIDPHAALDWLAANEVGDAPALMQSSSGEVFKGWMETDAAAARAYAETVAPGPTKNAMHAALTADYSSRGRPADAAALFDQMTGPGRPKLAGEIAWAMARKDPAAAAAWAADLSADEEQAAAVTSIVDSWSWTSPAAVLNWIEEFPEGELRDRAIGASINRFGSLDTGSSAEWVLQIGDSWERALAAQKVFTFMRVR